MTDYRNLMERCKEVLAWKKTGKTEGDARRNYDKYSLLDFLSGGLQQAEKSTMDDAMMAVVELVALVEKLQSRVAELESRLEVAPEHDIDGIAARDATIKLQDGRIAELEAERNIWHDKCMTQAGQLDLLKEAATFLASERASREKQEPVTTVEDRYNADGKSCHITDDLPAGMPLYAAPPVAASVRLTEKDQDNLAIPYTGMGGVEDYRAYARAIETFVLRANGFKVEGEQ